jgi:hypothetical protein
MIGEGNDQAVVANPTGEDSEPDVGAFYHVVEGETRFGK